MANASTRKSQHRRAQAEAVSEEPSQIRGWALGLLVRVFLLAGVAALTVAVLVGIGVYVLKGMEQPPIAIGSIGIGPSPTAVPTLTPTRTPTPQPPRVAILAGHWSFDDPQGVTTIHDTGALCDDGLREVTINKAVADKLVALLRKAGYRIDLLEEFDPRLKEDAPDYAPVLLLSIHSDSCVTGPDYPFATGYKIAHAEPSYIPMEDDRLVGCLTRDYQKAVDPFKLTFNRDTITSDMTAYHAFREVVGTTPAAIIELGFMGRDRDLLTHHQDELAAGLANGLLSFLRGDRCGVPLETPTPPS